MFQVLIKLEKLRESYRDAESLEESLTKMEAGLVEALRREIARNSLAEITTTIETKLAKQKQKMDPEVYRRTYDLMLSKRLFEEANMPRLSLFYL